MNMRVVKSERLKKLETELNDLEQWLKLGLVPKKDVKKHEEEIVAIKEKIQEEKDRLQFLRESGEGEEYQPVKKGQRTAYTDMPTIPDIDVPDTGLGMTEGGYENENETTLSPTSGPTSRDDSDEETSATSGPSDEDEDGEEEEDEESYFSDRNRWRRGGIVDPDADDW